MVMPFTGNSAEPAEVTLSTRSLDSCSSFASLLTVIDCVRCAPTHIEKCTLLSDYLSNIPTEEVANAARLLCGKIDQPETELDRQLLRSSFISALAACSGATPAFVKERADSCGSLSKTAYSIFSGGLTIEDRSIASLADVNTLLNKLKTIRGSRKRTETITAFLRKCALETAAAAASIVCGEFDTGIHEGLIKSAVSHWLNISVSKVQSINLTTGDIGETVLLCMRGDTNAVGIRPFDPVHAMSAVEVMTVNDVIRLMPPMFAVEDRYDGVRVQLHVSLEMPGENVTCGATYCGIRVVIFSETLDDITMSFPELVPSLCALMNEQAGTVEEAGVILDGAIVAISGGVFRPVKELSKRLNISYPSLQIMQETPVAFVAFDQLYGEGRSLLKDSWEDRQLVLNKIYFDQIKTFRSSTKKMIDGQSILSEFSASLIRGHAGLVIKNPRSKYQPGRVVADWLNIKHLLPSPKPF